MNSENPPDSNSTKISAIVGGRSIHTFPILFSCRPDLTALLHPKTPLIGVVGGLAAVGIAAVLLMALHHRLRHERVRRPQTTLNELEAPPDSPVDNTAQPTAPPGLVSDQPMRQIQTPDVSLRSAIYFVLYRRFIRLLIFA
jgi:hypothetical protein